MKDRLRERIQKEYEEKMGGRRLTDKIASCLMLDCALRVFEEELAGKDSLIANLRSRIRDEQDAQDELNETNRVLMDHVTELKAKIKYFVSGAKGEGMSDTLQYIRDERLRVLCDKIKDKINDSLFEAYCEDEYPQFEGDIRELLVVVGAKDARRIVDECFRGVLE